MVLARIHDAINLDKNLGTKTIPKHDHLQQGSYIFSVVCLFVCLSNSGLSKPFMNRIGRGRIFAWAEDDLLHFEAHVWHLVKACTQQCHTSKRSSKCSKAQ